MTKTIEVEVDLNDFDIEDLVTSLQSSGYVVIDCISIIAEEKLKHFKTVMKDYTLAEIENLLPRK